MIDGRRFIDREGGFVAEADGGGVNSVDGHEDDGADGQGEENFDEGEGPARRPSART